MAYTFRVTKLGLGGCFSGSDTNHPTTNEMLNKTCARIQGSKKIFFWTSQPLNANVLCSFEPLSNTNPVTKHHIPEELNPQCELNFLFC